VEFQYQGQTVKLQGVVSPSLPTSQEATLEEIDQWHQVNDIWALAVVCPLSDTVHATVPMEIQLVLEKNQRSVPGSKISPRSQKF
jgi:hypothetical protein